MNALLDIANKVVEELADYGAVLQYAPDYDLPKLATQRVVVVPMEKECSFASRNAFSYTHRIEIGILKRAKDVDLSTLIPMSESIGKSFLGKKILSETCVGVSWEPIYSADDLRAKNQFTSVISLTFREVGA